MTCALHDSRKKRSPVIVDLTVAEHPWSIVSGDGRKTCILSATEGPELASAEEECRISTRSGTCLMI